MTENEKQTRLSFNFYLKILLIAAFPIHLWSLLMIFRDLEFVSERTEMWDAVGYAGYALMLALVESMLVALIIWGLSFVLPKKWTTSRTFTVIASLYLILAGASIADMAFHAFNEVRISKQYLYGLATYPTLTYALIAGAIVVASVIVVILIHKSEKFEKAVSEIYERFTLLSYFYLVMDVIGIIIVIVRNVSESL